MNQLFYSYFSIFIVGIHFAFAVFLFYKIYFDPKNLYKYVFVSLNILYILLYPVSNGIVDTSDIFFISNRDYSYIFLYTEPILYYLFFLSFLELSKTSLLSIALKIGMLYWVVIYFFQYIEFDSKWLSLLDIFLNTFSRPLDLILTIWVFIYLLKFKPKYYQYAKYGVGVLVISAIIMALPNIAKSLNITIPEFFDERFLFFIMQIAVLIDFFLFLLSMVKKDEAIRHNFMKASHELKIQEMKRESALNEERIRIYRDMHDDLGASLSALKLQSEFIQTKVKGNTEIEEEVKELIVTTSKINTSMRRMLWSLSNADKNVYEFTNAIIDYCDIFLSKTKVNLSIHKTLDDETQLLTSTFMRHVYLCVKEILNNIYKHSHATHIEIHLVLENGVFCLIVKDDGVGFPADVQYGHGIYNMQSRMESIGGTLDILPSDKGTTVKLCASI